MYRAAFLPALVAVFVLAFSLEDVPRARTTAQATLAFDSERAYMTMRDFAARFPQRRPGSEGDLALADRVAERFEATGFAPVRRFSTTGATIDGDAALETVMVTREGISARTLLVIAHRDAAGDGAEAELSGTAVLLELARLFADRELKKTITLASVSGGSGGFAGARSVARAVTGPVDAVLVLGDLATPGARKPLVVPWANGAAPASGPGSHGGDSGTRGGRPRPGPPGMLAQFVRRAVPLTLSEQGEVNREGLQAVLLSASSERRPPPTRPSIRRGSRRSAAPRCGRCTRPSRRAARSRSRPRDGIVGLQRLLPDVGGPPARARAAAARARDRARRPLPRPPPRRGDGPWLAWAGAVALPPVAVAWLWARLLDLTGAVTALPAPGRAAPIRRWTARAGRRWRRPRWSAGRNVRRDQPLRRAAHVSPRARPLPPSA